MKWLYLAPVLAAAFLAAGCGRMEPSVKPYERALLNDPIMDRDRDPVSSTYMRHVQECGEAARGATGGMVASRSCY